jgi:hypothetical protein
MRYLTEMLLACGLLQLLLVHWTVAIWIYNQNLDIYKCGAQRTVYKCGQLRSQFPRLI